MGYIPKTTKAEIKVVMGLSLKRVFIILGATLSTNFIASSLTSSILAQVTATAAACVLSAWLTAKSPSNPNISYARGLVNFLMYTIESKKYFGRKTDEYEDFLREEAIRNEKKERKKAKSHKLH